MENIELRDFALEHAAQQAADDADREKLNQRRREGGFLSRFWKSHVRITIEEEVCRDHLALERTFLAYIRTATAYAQFGVTIAQLFRLNTSSSSGTSISSPSSTTLLIGKALGATTEGVAILIILLGAVYFAKQQMGLMKGAIVGRGWEVPVMLGVSFALFAVMLGLLAAVDKW